MTFYNNRVEIKYLIDCNIFHNVVAFLGDFGNIDIYDIDKEGYKINTFYLATWKSATHTSKNHGHLRIRSYLQNGKIYLEEKSKIRNKYYKQRYLINNEIKELLTSFNHLSQIEYFSKQNRFDFSNSLYFIADFDKFEIDYTRIAYTVEYKGLKFRATIDSKLKTSGNILLTNQYILELKTDKDFYSVSELFLKKFKLLPFKISKYKLLTALNDNFNLVK